MDAIGRIMLHSKGEDAQRAAEPNPSPPRSSPSASSALALAGEAMGEEQSLFSNFLCHSVAQSADGGGREEGRGQMREERHGGWNELGKRDGKGREDLHTPCEGGGGEKAKEVAGRSTHSRPPHSGKEGEMGGQGLAVVVCGGGEGSEAAPEEDNSATGRWNFWNPSKVSVEALLLL